MNYPILLVILIIIMVILIICIVLDIKERRKIHSEIFTLCLNIQSSKHLQTLIDRHEDLKMKQIFIRALALYDRTTEHLQTGGEIQLVSKDKKSISVMRGLEKDLKINADDSN